MGDDAIGRLRDGGGGGVEAAVGDTTETGEVTGGAAEASGRRVPGQTPFRLLVDVVGRCRLTLSNPR